jgi:hypothetical protein
MVIYDLFSASLALYAANKKGRLKRTIDFWLALDGAAASQLLLQAAAIG